MYNVIMIIDRRAEFYDVPWQQGRLLITPITEHYDAMSKHKINIDEQHCAFANFSVRDQGRSRIFLFRFNSPDECLRAVQAHNLSLRLVK